jgi:hypothetical protein
MRRLLVPVLVLAASLGSAPAVSADPPEHIWTPSGEPLEFAPGEVCDFGVRLKNAGRDVRTTVFPPAADGSEEVLVRGGFVGIATNPRDRRLDSRQGAAPPSGPRHTRTGRRRPSTWGARSGRGISKAPFRPGARALRDRRAPCRDVCPGWQSRERRVQRSGGGSLRCTRRLRDRRDRGDRRAGRGCARPGVSLES